MVLMVVSGLSQYSLVLGMVSGWTGQVLGFVGEVEGADASLIQVASRVLVATGA